MIAWTLLFLTAIFSHPAEAFGPTIDTDEIETSLVVGSNFLLQSLSVNRHFSVREDRLTGYSLLQENPNAIGTNEFKKATAEGEEAQKRQRALLNLSWMLGYAYFRSNGTDPVSGAMIADEAHAVEVGVAWQAAGMFDITAAGAYQVMPVENYSQGIFDLTFGYVIPLNSLPDRAEMAGTNQDAESYYVNKALEDEAPKYLAIDRFPNLRLGILAGFFRHTKSQTTSGRSAGSTLGADQVLNEAGSGPELVLHLTPKLSFRSSLLFYYYDNPPAGFLSQLTIGPFRTKANLAVADMEETTPFLLTYPKRTLNGSMTYAFSPSTKARVGFSYSTYDATSTIGAGALSSTLAAGGILDFVLGKRWKLGIVADLTTGSQSYSEATAGVTLGYAL